jgi:DNA polymerase III sliding clamp (beta) subunit (PCNA family)
VPREVAKCASEDEARPVLGAIQLIFDLEAQAVELVATDSYRLGTMKIEAELAEVIPDRSVLIPAKMAKALVKLLSRHDGQVILSLAQTEGDEALAEFCFGDESWLVREIEGDYPNWQRIIPPDVGGELHFDAEELSAAIQAAISIRTSKSTPIRLNLGDRCEVRLAEAGEAAMNEVLHRATYSPNGTGPLELALNPDFLRSGISSWQEGIRGCSFKILSSQF